MKNNASIFSVLLGAKVTVCLLLPNYVRQPGQPTIRETFLKDSHLYTWAINPFGCMCRKQNFSFIFASRRRNFSLSLSLSYSLSIGWKTCKALLDWELSLFYFFQFFFSPSSLKILDFFSLTHLIWKRENSPRGAFPRDSFSIILHGKKEPSIHRSSLNLGGHSLLLMKESIKVNQTYLSK